MINKNIGIIQQILIKRIQHIAQIDNKKLLQLQIIHSKLLQLQIIHNIQI